MHAVIRNMLITLAMSGLHLAGAAASLVPVSYRAGFDSDSRTFDFFIRFDRAPDFFSPNGNRMDNMQYWLNSMYGVNAFHTAMEMHLPKEMQLGTTSMLFITSDNTMALVRLDGTSPEVFGWRGTLVRELTFDLSPDHTLRFSLQQADLDDVDGGISAVFETYRPFETPSGMFVQQIPEPSSRWMLALGLALIASKRLKHLLWKAADQVCPAPAPAKMFSA